MKKKIIAILTMFLLLSVVSSVAVGAEENDTENSFLKFKSDVDISWNSTETSEPIMPLSSAKTFELDIKYKTEYSYELTAFFADLMKNRQIDILLEIIETPEWCQATLDKTTLSTTVSTEQINLSANLTVSVKENAIAYNSGTIKINASVAPQMGLLGILTLIDGFNETYELTITPDFLADISTQIDDTNYTQTGLIELPPYNETTIPITISNLGNAKTKVLAEIVEMPENWTVDIDPYAVLELDNSSQIYLTVESDHNFDNETITVQLTPVRYENTDDSGDSTNITIKLHNDGSYVEPSDETFEIDTTTLAIILLLIIIVVIVILIFIKRK